MKGNVTLSYCKLFVEIYGSIFKKNLVEIGIGPICDTNSRRSLNEGIRPGKQCTLEIQRSICSKIVSI